MENYVIHTAETKASSMRNMNNAKIAVIMKGYKFPCTVTWLVYSLISTSSKNIRKSHPHHEVSLLPVYYTNHGMKNHSFASMDY